ncbi:DEAD/DEAH box helicase family protein [Bacillus sp. FSL W7-1346]|uniref:DEAD/DEAH box helicase family protein n=1 Tax=Bacillus sp. FSL W7-1346 TaxID=2954565 RepID=UPI003159EFC9
MTEKTYSSASLARIELALQSSTFIMKSPHSISPSSVDQTMANDFKHLGDKMTKIKNRKVDKSYEIYLALYQGVTGTDDWKNIYKEFSPDFFNLIGINECHRGSAKEDSGWREILTYFSSATHVGLTATPKETKDVSNIHL